MAPLFATLLIVAGLAGAKPPPTPHPLGHWKVTRKPGAIVVSQRSGERGLEIGFSKFLPAIRLSHPPDLVLLCEDGRLSGGFLATMGTERSTGATRRLTYRLAYDGQAPKSHTLSTDQLLLSDLAMDKPHAFVKTLLSHRTLVLSFKSLNEEKDYPFDLTGLADVIAPLRAACGDQEGKKGPGIRDATGMWTVVSQGGAVLVSQLSAAEWPSWDGKESGRPMLILRCLPDDKDAYLFYEPGLPRAEMDLFVRFENEAKAKKYYGGASVDGKAVFFSGFWSKGTDGFIRSMLEHETLALDLRPKKIAAPPEATFDLRGLDPALTEWRQNCPFK